MSRNVRGVLAVEGVQTGDGRVIVEGATTWADLPLPLAWLDDSGHVLADEAPQVGTIDTITRDGNALNWTGSIDDEQPDGAEMVRRMEAGTASHGQRFGISIDPDDYEVEVVLMDAGDDEGGVIVVASGAGRLHLRAAAGDADPGEGGGEDGATLFEDATDSIIERYTRLRIRGATACPVPAFAEAYMELDGGAGEEPAEEEPEAEPVAAAAPRQVVAAAVPSLPPAAWFTDPELEEPTPLTVTDDGRVFGHLAAWGTCHIGRGDVCLEPPPSQAGYAHFLTATSRLDDGTTVPTGRLTAATGHADITADARAAASHYDDSGTAWAEVAAGEDDHGIWVAGAVLPDVDEMTLRRVQGLSLSGDWRRIGGSLELVAALSVNVPGFPIPRSLAASGALVPRVRMADGGCLALVAAGVVRPVTELDRVAARLDELEARLAAAERVTAPLESAAVDQLNAAVHPA